MVNNIAAQKAKREDFGLKKMVNVTEDAMLNILIWSLHI